MKRIGVLTSGGDAPGMNAAIRAIVRMGLNKDLSVMGINRGYQGLINGDIKEMTRKSVSDIIHKGGTILKTARCEEFKTQEGREKAVNILKVFGIEGLIVIGGDGSFTGARLLSDMGIKTIGIPGTIDNDLAYTDYTIGFYTAVNTVLDSINKLRDTFSSHERVSVIEVMGRNCGDIALYAGLAGGAETVIVPEIGFDIDQLCRDIIEGRNRKKTHHLVVLAEGVGGADELAKEVQNITGIETRATILSYIQRGGSPVAFDRIIASEMGAYAVELLLEGKSSRVIGIKKGDAFDMDINEALNIQSAINKDLYRLAEILSY